MYRDIGNIYIYNKNNGNIKTCLNVHQPMRYSTFDLLTIDSWPIVFFLKNTIRVMYVVDTITSSITEK